MKIQEIEGIGPAYAEKLNQAGIETVEQLLGEAESPEGRQAVAEKTGLDTKKILMWANMADLTRIKGVGGEYAELLKGSGVDTVKELGHRVAANLAAKMEEVNAVKKLTRKVPSATVVQGWIDQAKEMPARIRH